VRYSESPRPPELGSAVDSIARLSENGRRRRVDGLDESDDLRSIRRIGQCIHSSGVATEVLDVVQHLIQGRQNSVVQERLWERENREQRCRSKAVGAYGGCSVATNLV
jgi:hypothetical protein